MIFINNKNKLGASSWSIGKLLGIVLVVVLVILLIYGFSSGAMYRLYDNVENFYNNVAYYFTGGEDYEGGDGAYNFNAVILGEERLVTVDTQGYCSANIEELGKRYGLNPTNSLVVLDKGGWKGVDSKTVNFAELWWGKANGALQDYLYDWNLNIDGKKVPVEIVHIDSGEFDFWAPGISLMKNGTPNYDRKNFYVFLKEEKDYCLYNLAAEVHFKNADGSYNGRSSKLKDAGWKKLECPVIEDSGDILYKDLLDSQDQEVFEAFLDRPKISFEGKEYELGIEKNYVYFLPDAPWVDKRFYSSLDDKIYYGLYFYTQKVSAVLGDSGAGTIEMVGKRFRFWKDSKNGWQDFNNYVSEAAFKALINSAVSFKNIQKLQSLSIKELEKQQEFVQRVLDNSGDFSSDPVIVLSTLKQELLRACPN